VSLQLYWETTKIKHRQTFPRRNIAASIVPSA
jgi:hypothetical protein